MSSMVSTYHPLSLLQPHRVTRWFQVYDLAKDMSRRGWVGRSLIGYETSTRDIQLITGTHRLEAAFQVGIMVPVRVYPNNFLTRTLGRLRYWQCRLQGKL